MPRLHCRLQAWSRLTSFCLHAGMMTIRTTVTWRWTTLCTATTLRAARKSLGIKALAACTGQMGSATSGLVPTMCWCDLAGPACQQSAVLHAHQPVQSLREAALQALCFLIALTICPAQPSIPSFTGCTVPWPQAQWQQMCILALQARCCCPRQSPHQSICGWAQAPPNKMHGLPSGVCMPHQRLALRQERCLQTTQVGSQQADSG